MEAIVIAAGQGTRLSPTIGDMPKSLLPIGDGTILSAIVAALRHAGVRRVRLVVGCRKEQILACVHGWKNVTTYENERWQGGNGLSVLAALPDGVPEGGILLAMSDHLVPPSALATVARDGSRNALLLVDRRIDRIFDLPDATKLRTDGRRILAIGKELDPFDAIDCGVFRVTEPMRAALEANAREGRESITAAVESLIREEAIEAVEIPADCDWIDVDTPAAYAHAQAAPERYR